MQFLSRLVASMRLRLLLLAAAAITPFAGFIAYQAIDIKERRVAEAMLRAQQFVRLGADGYEDAIAEAGELLAALARAPQVRERSNQSCESYLTAMASARRWTSGLWIVGEDGRVRCTSVAGGHGLDLSGRSEYRAALSSDGLTVSDFFVGKMRHRPFALAGLRIPTDGGRFELISASIDLSWFDRMAYTIAERSETTVLLLDSKGTVLAGYPASRDLVGTNLADAPSFTTILKGEQGSFEGAGLSGKTAFFGYSVIGGSQLRLVVSYDRDVVLANHRRGTMQAVAIFLCVAALITGLIWFLGNRVFVSRMRELDRLLHATLSNMDQGLIVVDRKGSVPICNRRAMELLKLPPALMQSRPHMNAVKEHQLNTGEFDNLAEGVRGAVLSRAFDFKQDIYERKRPDGTVIEVRTSPIEGGGGYVRTYDDITERKAIEAQLVESEARYRLLAENSTDLIFKLDRDLVGQYMSPASLEILGWPPEELVGKTLIQMTHPDDAEHVAETYASVLAGLERASVAYRIRHRNDGWVWVEVELRLLHQKVSGEPEGILGSLRDISARKRAEGLLAAANAHLERLALQDGLTGLANRRHLDCSFEREFARARRLVTPVAVLLIDVDHFKAFNDHCGHLEGDACLKKVASIIAAQIKRPTDLVARYGGEEFAVLLPDTDLAGARSLAESICAAVRDHAIKHRGHSKGIVTVSIGVAAMVPVLNDQEADLLLQTDQALYQAKATGRDKVVDYCPAREANRTAA